MSDILLEFSLLFGAAIGAGMLMRMLKQPAFVGYLIIGLAAGMLGLASSVNRGLVELFSSYGVMLLLFLVGLEMNLSEIGALGKEALAVGLGQIVVTSSFFLILLRLLGLEIGTALFLSFILTFSSTIIVVKVLSEKHDLGSLSGKMALSILLIQDLAAILIMLSIGSQVSGGMIINLILKLALVFLITILAARKIMPRILHRLARSTDELILFSLAWCFLVASLIGSSFVGLSVEIGGFLAGLALSGSFEHIHIVTKIKPLRDFFLTIFFVSLGLSIRIAPSALINVIWLVPLIVFVKPLIVWILMRLANYRQRPAFMTGIYFGQVSEFGFVLAGMGLRLGLISEGQLAEVTLLGILSIIISGYLMVYGEKLFEIYRKSLDRLWPDRGEGELLSEVFSDHIVLLGCHRMGRSILQHLEKTGEKILIVDFDPEVVNELIAAGKKVIYADVADIENYKNFFLEKAKLVVSTVKDVKDSLSLLAEVKRQGLKVPVVVDAESVDEANILYEAGAAYVVFPHFVSGLHLGDLIKKNSENIDFSRYREAQKEILKGVFS